jgi:hypothetical protein
MAVSRGAPGDGFADPMSRIASSRGGMLVPSAVRALEHNPAWRSTNPPAPGAPMSSLRTRLAGNARATQWAARGRIATGRCAMSRVPMRMVGPPTCQDHREGEA